MPVILEGICVVVVLAIQQPQVRGSDQRVERRCEHDAERCSRIRPVTARLVTLAEVDVAAGMRQHDQVQGVQRRCLRV